MQSESFSIGNSLCLQVLGLDSTTFFGGSVILRRRDVWVSVKPWPNFQTDTDSGSWECSLFFCDAVSEQRQTSCSGTDGQTLYLCCGSSVWVRRGDTKPLQTAHETAQQTAVQRIFRPVSGVCRTIMKQRWLCSEWLMEHNTSLDVYANPQQSRPLSRECVLAESCLYRVM